MAESIEFLGAVLLVSKDAERLARFYRDALGLPLRDESHDDTALHYGCELGDLHFAIHPVENYQFAPETGAGGVRLAFTVFDLDSLSKSLDEKGIDRLFGPIDLGWSKMLALRDPDGNLVEVVQLTRSWYAKLKKRRAQGHDVIARFESAPK